LAEMVEAHALDEFNYPRAYVCMYFMLCRPFRIMAE